MATHRFSQSDLDAMNLELVPGETDKYRKKQTMFLKTTSHTDLVKGITFPPNKSDQYKQAITDIKNTSVLTIDGIVDGLNGSKGLMRSHWSNTKKIKDIYCKIIQNHLKQNKLKKHTGAVSIEYIGYKSLLMDWDNFCASFKHIGDSLVKMGIIKDDNPKIIQSFLPKQIKCKRTEQHVMIIIKDI